MRRWLFKSIQSRGPIQSREAVGTGNTSPCLCCLLGRIISMPQQAMAQS